MNDQPELRGATANAGEPAGERVISDVETLKALSDPVRLRILETMVTAADEAWTVKRLAAAMGVGPTKLYHHVNILEEHEFIRVAGTRVVSGIIETSYRIAQLSVRLDRALLTGGDPEVQGSLHDVLAVIFDSVRDEIERGLASGLIKSSDDPLSELLIRGLTRLRPDQAVELRRRLRELLAEFDADTHAPAEPGSVPFGYLVALYPFPDSTTTRPEASDD
ncbi:MAG TPA: helix-turn-helix domain-containing protein [Candidatus Limnocylindrales bacterium]|nr:helix-turn-helix domain-containing protein [Candidatus Limnocylindrales bacterium]